MATNFLLLFFSRALNTSLQRKQKQLLVQYILFGYN